MIAGRQQSKAQTWTRLCHVLGWCKLARTPGSWSSTTSLLLLRIWPSPAAVTGKVAGKLWIESWPFPRVRSLLRRCCLICLQLEHCLFGCPSCGLQCQLVRTQLASFKHAGFSVNSLNKVNRGEKYFGLLCTWLFVWEERKIWEESLLFLKWKKLQNF